MYPPLLEFVWVHSPLELKISFKKWQFSMDSNNLYFYEEEEEEEETLFVNGIVTVGAV